jgi:hypothetical protein
LPAIRPPRLKAGRLAPASRYCLDQLYAASSAGIDPFLPFKIGAMDGREARESVLG